MEFKISSLSEPSHVVTRYTVGKYDEFTLSIGGADLTLSVDFALKIAQAIVTTSKQLVQFKKAKEVIENGKSDGSTLRW